MIACLGRLLAFVTIVSGVALTIQFIEMIWIFHAKCPYCTS